MAKGWKKLKRIRIILLTIPVGKVTEKENLVRFSLLVNNLNGRFISDIKATRMA